MPRKAINTKWGITFGLNVHQVDRDLSFLLWWPFERGVMDSSQIVSTPVRDFECAELGWALDPIRIEPEAVIKSRRAEVCVLVRPPTEDVRHPDLPWSLMKTSTKRTRFRNGVRR